MPAIEFEREDGIRVRISGDKHSVAAAISALAELAPHRHAFRKDTKGPADKPRAADVLLLYIADCAREGIKPTLRGAETWSKDHGIGRSKSAFADTKIWKEYKDTFGSREERRRDRRLGGGADA